MGLKPCLAHGRPSANSEWMNEWCHNGNPVCPHSYLPLHLPSSLPHPRQRAAVSHLGFDDPCGRDHWKSFVHAPSSRKKRFSQSTFMFSKASEEEVLLIPRVTFQMLLDWWGILPHFSLLRFKPPTPTHPILFPWEMWQPAGRNRWGVPHSAKCEEWERIGLSHLLSISAQTKYYEDWWGLPWGWRWIVCPQEVPFLSHGILRGCEATWKWLMRAAILESLSDECVCFQESKGGKLVTAETHWKPRKIIVQQKGTAGKYEQIMSKLIN